MEIVSALLYLAMALPDISAASDAGAPQVIERFSEKKDCESFVDKIARHYESAMCQRQRVCTARNK